MIERNKCAEYYAGCRDAVFQYAVYKDGVMYVGCGIQTYHQALEEINKLDDESPDGLKARLTSIDNPYHEVLKDAHES